MRQIICSEYIIFRGSNISYSLATTSGTCEVAADTSICDFVNSFSIVTRTTLTEERGSEFA